MRIIELDYVALWLIYKFVVKPIFRILRNLLNTRLSLFSFSSAQQYDNEYTSDDYDDDLLDDIPEDGAIKRAGNNNNPSELPAPKRILYPRESVRVGWHSTARKWQVGVGMCNVGNTCYLNSTLQALFHVPSMANWLMSDSQHMERCEASECIVCAMAKTLHESQTKQSPIRPYQVYQKLKCICKHLVMGRQEDAHEFLRYLVEAMEKSYLARFRNYKELDQYSKETTPLNQILGGYLKSAVRCLSCGHVSVTFQHFQDLLLDIRKADTVEEALDGYFSRERLEDMGYKCESCKKKVSATKQFSLERAPIALCIQLKRFSMLGNKLSKTITIKPRLDLSKFASRKGGSGEQQLTYKLVAMVTHLGASQHCGHYTAIGLTESGTYYNYDDSYVRPISVQNVCNTNAYIIFYEMENAPATSRQVTSTQVSGAMVGDLKSEIKMNGNVVGVGSPMIGPQLPPGGLNKTQTIVNGGLPLAANNYCSSSSSSTYNGSKMSIHRQGAIPTSSNICNNSPNNKSTIHFKNQTNNNNNNSYNAGPMLKPLAATATSTSNNNTQNGPLMGTGRFQESTNSKFSLVGSSNKEQAGADPNGNNYNKNTCSRGSTPSFSSDNEDEVSSSTQPSKSNLLPSMPQLLDSVSNNSNNNHKTIPTPPNTPKSQGFHLSAAGNTPSSKLSKSLVPYETESDDEMDSNKLASSNNNNNKFSSASATLAAINQNPLKRRSSLSSFNSCSSDEEAHSDEGPSNGVKVKKAASSSISSAVGLSTSLGGQLKSKSKSHDAIDEIFGSNSKRSNASNSNSLNTPFKKQQQRSQSQQFVVSSTTANNAYDDNDDYEDLRNTRPDSSRRSNSTPNSPPVIKTPTGVWQVTALETKSLSDDGANTNNKPPTKNPKNPFATKSPELQLNKRSKLNSNSNNGDKSDKHRANGNGYTTTSNAADSELLKQSHRGYGTSVLTWNGQQSEIEKQIIAEAREQRQRDWEEEDENEMDRGRQKKIKAPKDSNHMNNRAPGYNPFQEMEPSSRRWKHGGGNGASHRHGGHFRNKFQNNKFKFQRFNHNKHQRSSQYQQQRHHNGSGSNTGNGYSRRDS